MSYTKKRYLTYLFITAFTLVIPFITIDGNHMLLLSFDKLQFHILGFVYNVNELYVMPFLLMFLFIGIFAMTTIFGRVWCGWSCPQTIFRTIYRDLIESTILDIRRIKNKQKDIDYSKKSNQLKKYISIFLWIIISTIIATNFMWYFVPPEDFFVYIQDPANHSFMIIFIISIAMFLVFDIVFMKENFCVYICPYSRIQSVLYDDDTKQVVYDTSRGGNVFVNNEKSIFKMKEWKANEECTTCEACVKICPTNIDIRKGLQVECINCLECSDACTTVMGKLGKKSLINWGSTNSVINKRISRLLTKRNVTYFISLLLCVILAGVFASKKEYFLLNINKTTKLYNIKENAKVSNNYILTFQNTQDKTYTFDLSLEDKENFRIKRFKPFSLAANKRIKKILIIETKKRLYLSDKKDTPLKIKLIARALEDKKITLQRELAFIYPRNDLIKD
ncbi:cytochrome c oxidase accessory protein CcoG [Poseidonibacter antarcticus]|uniref:cytochrome c oxidase accessory protein CcoG n=1 Tax=Poseidonibacter antarcticus TaxID=2478538 RepID=UPI000EF4F729|nr:cytochrome c oxidase accessory protein CcoG [Poseidonibacter antarcticus]